MAEAIAERRYPCPGCGGELCWEPTRQALACTACGTTRPLEPPPVAQAKFIEPGMAESLRSANDAHAPPECVVPFLVSEADARLCALQRMHSAWLTPRALARQARTGEVKGIYVPAWTFDSHAVAHWEGTGIRGIIEMDFDDVAVCADRATDAALMQQLEPWPAKALRPYDPRFLAGWTALRSEVSQDEATASAHARMEREMLAAAKRNQPAKIRETMRMLGAEYPREASIQVLMPVWRFDYAYLGRRCLVLVNGANGKSAGRIPKSPFKIALLAIVGLWFGFLFYDPDAAVGLPIAIVKGLFSLLAR